MENPYKAPVEGPAQSKTRGFGSRLSIVFVALVFATISALSIIGFLYNLTINYPGTDRPVIEVDPLWMFGHIIRGIGLGLLAYFLLRYQSAMKNWRGPIGEDAERLIARHDAVWRTGALVLGALTVFSIVYVLFGHASM